MELHESSTLAKANEIKSVMLLGTSWRTHGEQQNYKKSLLPKTQKKKNLGSLKCMLNLLIGCLKFLFLKFV
jgi:hypothetical protein